MSEQDQTLAAPSRDPFAVATEAQDAPAAVEAVVEEVTAEVAEEVV